MIIPSTLYFALAYGVPVAAFLAMLAATLKAKGKTAKRVFLSLGAVAAVGYFIWFEFAVRYDTLAIYSAENCSAGQAMYRLPFGDSGPLAFDDQPDDPAAIWIAVQNRTDQALVFDMLIYTKDGTPPAGANTQYDGHIVPPGETHGFTIPQDNFYFLTPAPETFTVTSGFDAMQLLKYEVRCAS